jgi:hypothetical protein
LQNKTLEEIVNDLQATYQLTKKMILLREEITNWARISRESKISENDQRWMMIRALEIDELLREIGTDWLTEYEQNIKFRAVING